MARRRRGTAAPALEAHVFAFAPADGTSAETIVPSATATATVMAAPAPLRAA